MLHRMDNIGAIVLAAGKSSRMGQCKSLLDINGRPMIQHVLDGISGAGIAKIVVVTGHEPEKIELAIRNSGAVCIYNPDHAEGGMISSVKTGVAALPGNCGAFLLALGDHPLVRPQTIRQMAETFLIPNPLPPRPVLRERAGVRVLREQQETLTLTLSRSTGRGDKTEGASAKIVQPVHQGRGGHPIMISTDYSQQILQLPASATLKIWMGMHQPQIVALDTDDRGILIDVDTPEEYHQIVCQLRVASK